MKIIDRLVYVSYSRAKFVCISNTCCLCQSIFFYFILIDSICIHGILFHDGNASVNKKLHFCRLGKNQMDL